MNSIINFTSTLKPAGKEYKKITYWNRFIRTKTESILTFGTTLLAILYALTELLKGNLSTILAIICVIAIFYCILIITQFNSSIKYHLKHRDPSEDAPCNYSLMSNGILIDVPGYEAAHHFYKYDEFTSVYLNVFGFFMMYIDNTPVLVIRRSDIPSNEIESFEDTLVTSVSEACKVKKF